MQSLSTIIEAPLKLLRRYEVESVIIGGVAAALYGSAQLTNDLDVCYARNPANLERLADALQSVRARLRGAPEDIPFILDAETLRRGLELYFHPAIRHPHLLRPTRGAALCST